MESQLKHRIGLIAGLTSLFAFIVILPIIISLDNDFVVSLTYFDPLSDLGTSPDAGDAFNAFLMINGILLYLYYSLYFTQIREVYTNFGAWKFVQIFGKLAGFGQFGIGFFANSDALHALHMISGILFFGGVVLIIMILSADFEVSFYDNRLSKFLVIFGYVIGLFSILYPFYFSSSKMKGIWQFSMLFAIILWHFVESYQYKHKISLQEKIEISDRFPYFKLIYYAFFVGFFLIVQGLYYIFSNVERECGTGENITKCSSVDNLITLGSGIVLFMATLIVYIKVKSMKR
ncbi:MAG: DUF998 domain-containing protein [Candidatus Kariarchaeaceae archaeon]